jgi:hypothetical protein
MNFRQLAAVSFLPNANVGSSKASGSSDPNATRRRNLQLER